MSGIYMVVGSNLITTKSSIPFCWLFANREYALRIETLLADFPFSVIAMYIPFDSRLKRPLIVILSILGNKRAE